MRLDFNVLWVEDQPDNVSDQKERIESQIRKEGFKLVVKFADSVDKATAYLANDIYGDHIDLILMDYDLGPGKSGDEGLTEVRHIFPYKDLIFYSAHATARLSEMVTEQKVQGVFTAHRPALPDTVEEVFRNLVRKVLDIDHSRGIVIGATSDVDDVIFAELKKLFDSCEENEKENALQHIRARAVEKRESLDSSIAEIQKIEHVDQLENHHHVYTSDDRFRLLQKIMKQLGLHADKIGDFDSYRRSVPPRRNDLAHIKVTKEGFARTFQDRNGKVITSDEMRELRVTLLEFQEFLEKTF